MDDTPDQQSLSNLADAFYSWATELRQASEQLAAQADEIEGYAEAAEFLRHEPVKGLDALLAALIQAQTERDRALQDAAEAESERSGMRLTLTNWAREFGKEPPTE